MSDLFATIRDRTAQVMQRARAVRVVPAGVEALAERLLDSTPPAPCWDVRTHYAGSPAATLAYVLTLASINFGSGYFPHLRKPAGSSGYVTVATALKRRFQHQGPWTPVELTALEVPDLADVLGQDCRVPAVAELLQLYVDALRDLGELVLDRYAGRFELLVGSAGGSAEALVETLSAMPFFRDVERYHGLEVPFYKRAQLAASDLDLALAGRGLGRFQDLDRLTAFADNLVPHVLRLEGALSYSPALLARIEAGEPIAAGSPEEVEIRAGCVHAVELLVGAIRSRNGRATARELDFVLWQRGQRPEIKARPRHRTRTVSY